MISSSFKKGITVQEEAPSRQIKVKQKNKDNRILPLREITN